MVARKKMITCKFIPGSFNISTIQIKKRNMLVAIKLPAEQILIILYDSLNWMNQIHTIFSLTVISLISFYRCSFAMETIVKALRNCKEAVIRWPIKDSRRRKKASFISMFYAYVSEGKTIDLRWTEVNVNCLLN